MKKILSVLLVLFAQQAFANCELRDFDIQPRPLWSDEAGEVWFTGFCADSNVPRFGHLYVDGNHITIVLDLPGDAGITIPTRFGERVKLPLLPPGFYQVEVFADGLGQLDTQSLVVRERPFKIAGAFAGDRMEFVITELPLVVCDDCRDWGVRFGDVPATNVLRTEKGLIGVVPLNPGSDVTVELPDRTSITFEDGWHFGLTDPASYERIMFPVNFTGRGAHGSDWHSDIVIRNDAPITVGTMPLFWGNPAIPTLPSPEPVEPGGKGNFPEVARDGGAYLYVPRGLESSFSYASHIVDRSRSTTDLGTEVPVVRAKDTANEIKLLEVPVDPRYRAKLRVYDFDGDNDSRALLTLRNPLTKSVLMTMWLELEGSPVCGGISPCFPDRPSFGVIDLEQLPQLTGVELVDVTLQGGTNDTRLWAFVSVTSNDTQSVTLYTPQHKRPPK